MGNWDNIYKKYQQGGEAWATLSEGIDPRFIQLVENNNFTHKKALDIGCGTGKYLAFLENNDFNVTGIDSSPTAVEMTKKLVSPKAVIKTADMYSFKYPKNKFNLVLSISTLHHGSKSQVIKAIKAIHASLVADGKIFITLPNFDASNKWDTFKDDTELEPGTYAPNSGPEQGLPHSFFTKDEVESIFVNFNNLSLELDKIGRWFIVASK
jgi:SAM-dependent methyltransferase